MKTRESHPAFPTKGFYAAAQRRTYLNVQKVCIAAAKKATVVVLDEAVILHHNDDVLCNRPGFDLSTLKPCNHPEADMRMVLHLAHAGA